MSKQIPPFILAADAVPRSKATHYPALFAGRLQGRVKRPLGDVFGLKNFGVNYTTLAPGGMSALRHAHTVQDEFVYVLRGNPTLIVDEGEFELSPGTCVGFPAGGAAHHLVNRSDDEVIILEIGDRTAGDEGRYPDDDLRAVADSRSGWRFTHKNGNPYE